MRPLLLALVAAALAAATPAAAQAVSPRPDPQVDLTGFIIRREDVSRAVGKVEYVTDGRVVEIRPVLASRTPSYDMVVARGRRVTFIRYSRSLDRWIRLSAATAPQWMLDWRAQTNLGVVHDAPIGLREAILEAEVAAGLLPAVAAGVAHSAADPTSLVPDYNVLIFKANNAARVGVNAETGQVALDPSLQMQTTW
jgi:hypothetical protein